MGGFLQNLIQQLGAGGVSGPGGTSDPTGTTTSAMASELHGADPSYLLRSLQQCKQQLSQLFVMSSMRLPNVAGQIAKSMTQLDRAIKEAQQAASTQSVVRAPIGFSMAGGPGEASPGI